MPPDLIERLREQLRRDPSDSDLAFLLSVAVRDPFLVYAAERQRLRRLTSAPGRSTRELLVAEAAEHLLAWSGNTPGRGFRRPVPGSLDVVEPRQSTSSAQLGGDEVTPPKIKS